MKVIIAYAICGILTALIAMFEKYHKGEFDPHNADENDEEAIGNIVLLWWLYIYQRLTQGESVMEISEAIERLEYLKVKALIALEQEIPEWVAEDILGTIEAYDMAIEALRDKESE